MYKCKKIVAVVMAIVAIMVVNCKKPDSSLKQDGKKESVISAVVVFSVGESVIKHADSTEEKAVLGSVLKPGDQITTKKFAKVDIQVGDGSAVRLASESTLDVSKLVLNTNGSSDTQLALVSGRVFAKVKKSQKDDSFSVITPTAIAGVRGTSFIVDVAKDKKSSVTVVDGSVALGPRVGLLEKASDQEIEKNAELKSLKAAADKETVIIEMNQSSQLGQAKDLDAGNAKSVQSAVEKIDLKVVSAKPTRKMEEEIKSIVIVDNKIAGELSKLNEVSSSDKMNEKNSAEVEKERERLEKLVTSQYDKNVSTFKKELEATPKPLNDKKSIFQYYESLEKIILVDNSVIYGAIINQEGNILVVHTENGIRRLNKETEVKEVYPQN